MYPNRHQTMPEPASDPAVGPAGDGLVDDWADKNRRESARAKKEDKRREVFTTLLSGIVDVVEANGEPAFLMQTPDGGIELISELETGDEVLRPFPKSEIPWALPRYTAVLEAFESDSPDELYIDLKNFISTAAGLPDTRWADLLSAWTLLTYRLESVHYLPLIYIHGVPERGKTRLGKALAFASWRGLLVPGLREAVLLRWRSYHRATLCLDIEDIAKEAKRAGVDDLLLSSFERGATVARVLWPERGAGKDMRHFEAYGPSILVSNVALRSDSALATRFLPIVLPESGHVDFGYPTTPEDGLPFRERALAWRAQTMGEPLPEVERAVDRRLGDITLPILQVLAAVKPEMLEPVSGFIVELESDIRGRRSDSFEGRVLEALIALPGEVSNSQLALKKIREQANKDVDASEVIAPRTIGRIVRSLGFDVRRGTNGTRFMVWSDQAVHAAASAFGLGLDGSFASSESLDSKPVYDAKDAKDASEHAPQQALWEEGKSDV